MSLNRVTLIGNLGDTPKRISGTTTDMCVFRIATNERVRSKGQTEMRTEWHSVVTFGKIAEICSSYLHKGSKVYLEGSLRTRSYEDKTGNPRQSVNIVASVVNFLDPKAPSKGTEPDFSPEAGQERALDLLEEVDF